MASPPPACAHSLGARSTAIWCPLCPLDRCSTVSSDGTSVRGPDHVITDWPMTLVTSLLTTCEICE
ncbi:unnamed protein product [Staurois parvus]|uniref:Uncharacterized protein n=1 Tax=Staurois parvus TaxID=386267 RepID=A0ABN9BPS7_9NEOB|nr:unnamed protein product [Staurois parvus]